MSDRVKLSTIRAKSLKLGIIADLSVVRATKIASMLATVIDKKIAKTKTSFLT